MKMYLISSPIENRGFSIFNGWADFFLFQSRSCREVEEGRRKKEVVVLKIPDILEITQI